MKLSVLFILCLCSITASAQQDVIIRNDRSKNTDSLILYVGFPNTLMVYNADGSPAGDATLLSPDDMVQPPSKGDSTHWIRVLPKQEGLVTLKLRAGDDIKTIQAFIRLAEDWYVALNRERETVFTRNKLLSFKGLNIYNEDRNLKFRMVVTSYTFTWLEGKEVREIKVNGPYFSNEVREVIKGLSSGSRIFFEEIRVQGPDTQTRRFNSFSIKVL